MRDWIASLATAGFCMMPCLSARAECPNPTVEELRIKMGLSSAEIPGRLEKPRSRPSIGCDRPFLFRGEVYAVDAPQAQDASNLRLYVREVPEADSILAEYQNRRDRSRLSAYTGTLGLILYLVANSLSKGAATPESQSLWSTFKYTGLALTAGGFIYSYSLLSSNERLIPQSVDAYNRAKPKEPIELKFETGWSF